MIFFVKANKRLFSKTPKMLRRCHFTYKLLSIFHRLCVEIQSDWLSTHLPWIVESCFAYLRWQCYQCHCNAIIKARFTVVLTALCCSYRWIVQLLWANLYIWFSENFVYATTIDHLSSRNPAFLTIKCASRVN